ncbi:MAG: winged helix-turn-helix domain-containing protein [Acidimicrobiales bacterium]
MVVCVALDTGSRERVAKLLDGVGMLIMAPDLRTAHAILGRQVELEAFADGLRHADEPIVQVGDLEIDRVHCRVRWRGVPLALTRRERDLLACLGAEPTKVWSYERLHAAAWDDRYLDPASVHAAIKRLRRKLRDAGVKVRVESVRGVGYQLLGE